MTYNDAQFKIVERFVPKRPDWLILGGPADGNEAQWAEKLWPGIRIIGVEPVLENIQWQLANDWPKDYNLLIQFALGDDNGSTTINVPENKRAGSCLSDRPGIPRDVPVITIDTLNTLFGPFKNCILWLDIEGWEYKALVGALELFSSGEVTLVNVEILERLTEHTALIEKFFSDFGFKLAHVWNEQPGLVQDRIYVKDQ